MLDEQLERRGFTLTATVEPGDRIISLVEFQGQLIVATERGVWIKVGDVFQPVQFVAPDDH